MVHPRDALDGQTTDTVRIVVRPASPSPRRTADRTRRRDRSRPDSPFVRRPQTAFW